MDGAELGIGSVVAMVESGLCVLTWKLLMIGRGRRVKLYVLASLRHLVSGIRGLSSGDSSAIDNMKSRSHNRIDGVGIIASMCVISPLREKTGYS